MKTVKKHLVFFLCWLWRQLRLQDAEKVAQQSGWRLSL